jgi:DNA anti-recombination protein RmuC
MGGVILSSRSFFVSYIVRIYRFRRNKPHALLGVVEEVGKKGKKAFTHYDELWEVLNSAKGLQFHKAEEFKRLQAKRKKAPEKKGGNRD